MHPHIQRGEWTDRGYDSDGSGYDKHHQSLRQHDCRSTGFGSSIASFEDIEVWGNACFRNPKCVCFYHDFDAGSYYVWGGILEDS